MVERRELIAEGKTKKIFRKPFTTTEVLIESKDDVTAGDGARRSEFEDKGVYATETTVNSFTLLTHRGIPNHFLARGSEKTFYARELRMIPIEVVVRRLATGSYLKRKPEVEEGTRFSTPLAEFFYKDDPAHDPLLIYDFVSCRILRYNAKLPIAQGFIEELPMEGRERTLSAMTRLVELAEQTFLVLEEAWAKQDVTLVDLKIECGQDVTSGEIVVGDVITNDEWRLWPDGVKARQLDKQSFREMGQATKEAMAALRANYAKVAEMTRLFIS